VLYRLYRPEDFAQLYAIERICFQAPFRFSRQYMRELVESANSATWIAEEDGEMAGFAVVKWIQEADQIVAYVETLEVTPTQRKRGIAGELLRRVETSARAACAHVLWLHVAEANAAAIHLYVAHDYLPQGKEEDYYGLGIPALIYAKLLTPA
jgi:ribosomal-protein-alanine N-acetyltransferase